MDNHIDKNDDWKNPPKCFKCNKAIDCGNMNPAAFQKLNDSAVTFMNGGESVSIPYIQVAKYFSENIFRKEVKCPLKCGAKYDSLDDAMAHFDKCPKRFVQCQDCHALHTIGD